MVVFTPKVDEYLENAPPEFWDGVALCGILFGTALAFHGKTMTRMAVCFCGVFSGMVLSACALTWLADAGMGEVNPQLWLGMVLFCGLVVGITVDRIVWLSKLAACVAFGLCATGVMNQYLAANVTSSQQQQQIVAWAVRVGCVLLGYLMYDVALVYCSSFVGGFICLLGVGRLVRGPISPGAMWANSDWFLECNEWSCFTPLVIGALVCLAGLRYQLKPYSPVDRERPLLV
ncbi:hypothetical protein BASA81_006701 [Batrachochytrium salamandrivorans]|nr:hypothetical protein BASA81_006701 [Batrachochytrium salamandrivorans]